MEATLKTWDVELISPRIRYYLLDWKDKNLDEFSRLTGQIRLGDLTARQLLDLYRWVSHQDEESLIQFKNQYKTEIE